MDMLDAYAPPKTLVTDVDAEPPKIPLAFKILLVTFLTLSFVGLVIGANMGGLLWLGVMAIASWKTFQGSRAASRVLGALLVLNTVIALVTAFPAFARGGVAAGVVMLVMAVWLGGLALCIYLHPGMQAVFRKAESKKWSGG